MRVAAIAVLALLASLVAAKADGDCSASLADWQPRQALVAQLEADGWQDVQIRVEDGCYRVHAVNAAGDRLHGKFDPATLARVHGGHGRHGGEGRGPAGSED
jgi:hypothetical protein